MAREYARIRVSINGDDEFEALPADAQWLYTRVLLTEASLSAAGIADWRPSRLTVKAADMTKARLVAAAAVLERRRFALFDLDTEEVLVRSYIRSDDLLRNPKMAVAVVKAYGAVASKSLRAAIISEIKRVRSESPDFSCWTYKDTGKDLADLMKKADADSVPYTNAYPVSIGDADPVPIANRITNQNGNPDPGTEYQPEYQSDSVPIPCNLQPSTYSHQPEGLRNRGTSPAEAEPDPDNPPPPHCSNHPGGTEAPCRACGDARESRKRWDRALSEQQRAQHEDELQAAYEAKLAAIALCEICDSDGYDGTRVCDHVDRTEVAKAGLARARAALENPPAATG